MQSLSQQFLTFCRSKSADETYDYASNYDCAFAQFLKAAGICNHPDVGGYDWKDDEGQDHVFGSNLERVLSQNPTTFGALADRLEAELAK